jgi:maltooligosyltrehalose trehalohydrolase
MLLSKRKIGLNFITHSTAELRVWAPLANTVKLEINNRIKYNLKPVHMGFWEVTEVEVNSGDIYNIFVDGKQLPDPASLHQPEGVHSSSRAFDTGNYSWNDHKWKGIAPEDLIIYELHTGTFTATGTFEGIESKLTYLKELGINTIELMPVAQFPGTRNWGYDGVYPFAVQQSYGGPEKLQHLVDVCHQNGMAVILDVVYNHLGPEGNYFYAYGPVFTAKYTTPWGQAINFDDAWSDGIRIFFIENALMWLRDFHIDGLRLDAVHALKDFGSKHFLQELKEQVKILNSEISRRHFLICESDLNDVRYLEPFEKGGYEMDATWCDEFHHAVHALVTGEKNGYYADFGETHHLVKSLNDAFVYDGIWTEHRKRIFGSKTTGIAAERFVVFIQNHDQVGNRMTGERLASLISFEKLKAAAGLLLVSPFTPLLFMGEEYAETNPFLYFTNHSDPELIRMVREGRKKEFEAFMNLGEAPDPDDENTFLNSKLNWDQRSTNQSLMLSFYKELIRLRKTIPAFKNSGIRNYKAGAISNKNCIYLYRKHDTVDIMAMINFEPEPVTVDIAGYSSKIWQLFLNSSALKWGGPGKTPEYDKNIIVTPPESITIWISSTMTY